MVSQDRKWEEVTDIHMNLIPFEVDRQSIPQQQP